MAGVVGAEFELAVVKAVSGVDEEGLLAALEEAADELGVTVSALITDALDRHLAKQAT